MGSFFCELSLIIICIIWSFFVYDGSLAMTPNVALGKSTMQSSNYDTAFMSHLANDGNRQQHGPNSMANTCTHTNTHPNEWWVVNLGAIFDIYNIIIYGRDDCCVDRFQDFDVDVIARISCDQTLSTVDLGRVTFRRHVKLPVTYTQMSCPNNTPQGQFVRLRHRGTRILTICEVEVYGKHSTCLKASDVSCHHGYPGMKERQFKPCLSTVQFNVWLSARMFIAAMLPISTSRQGSVT